MTWVSRVMVISVMAGFLLFGLTGTGCIPTAVAQEPPDTLRDDFLADLEGEWRMDGHVLGDSVVYRATGTWVLAHQFLRLRMTHVGQPAEYRAHVYIGYDHAEETYVAHWLDDTGAGASRTLGVGTRNGEMIRFSFEYPDGPFRTIFERRSPTDWRIRMRRKKGGEWKPFASYVMTPQTTP